MLVAPIGRQWSSETLRDSVMRRLQRRWSLALGRGRRDYHVDEKGYVRHSKHCQLPIANLQFGKDVGLPTSEQEFESVIANWQSEIGNDLCCAKKQNRSSRCTLTMRFLCRHG